MNARFCSAVLTILLALAASGPAAEPPPPRTDAHGDALPAGASLRLGTARLRHGECVTSVAFSPDGTLLATKDCNLIVSLWDVKTGKELRQFSGRSGGFAGGPAVFSPDGTLLASGDGTQTLHIWEVATGKSVRQYPGKGSLTALAFSPDGKHLALASYDKSLLLFDWAAGKEVRKFSGHKERPTSLAFTRNGQTLAAAHGDGAARFWDVATGKEVRRFEGHKGWVNAVALAPDDQTLATGGSDQTIRLWDAASGKELRQLEGVRNQIYSVAFTPDGKHVAAGVWGNHLIGLWDAATGKLVRQIGPRGVGRATSNSICACIAFAPDGKTLAARGQDHNVVILWDVATGKELLPFDAHATSVDLLAVTPDGQTLASASHADEAVYLWDLARGTLRRKVPGHAGGIAALAFAPDGKTLVAAAVLDQSVYLWDAATGKRLLHIPPPDLPADPGRLFGHLYRKDVAIAFAPDGKTLATGNSDGKVRLWELPSGKPLLDFQGQPARINSDNESYPRAVSKLAYSPEGRSLIVGSLGDDTFHLYTAAGKLLRQFKPKPPATPAQSGYSFWDVAVAFAPDGKSLAAAGGRLDLSIRLWETATAQERRKYGGPQRALHLVAFSPDGRTLASWRRDGVIRLLDVATGQDAGSLQGHRGEVLSVAFLPDGRVVSGGTDTTILLWDSVPRKKAAPPALSARDLDALWADLAHDDAGKAAQAIHTLALAPPASVPFLANRLSPIAAPDAKELARLLADLDSNQFAVRQKAADDLEKLGELAGPALRKLLADRPSAEVERAANGLLERLDGQVLSGEKLRAWRAVEALELAGTPEARQVLEKLAAGAEGAPLTRDAQRALQRLAR
jgi:WD40 repeat protein